MSTQANPNTSPRPRSKWLWPGVLVALLAVLGVVLAVSRGGRERAPENSANPAPTVASPGTTPPGSDAPTAASGSFAEAAKTWSEIEAAKAELDNAVSAEKLDRVHPAALEIRDHVRRLPETSTGLPEPKQQALRTHMQHVDQLAQMLDEAGDSKNVRATHQHHAAMNEALGQIRSLYPEGVLPAQSPMDGIDDKMQGQGMGGGMMDDDKMGGMGMKGASKGGKSGMSGGMMDDKMGGAGMGGMMDDDKMGGMGGGTKDAPKGGKKSAPSQGGMKDDSDGHM
jgi:hypothetical protein